MPPFVELDAIAFVDYQADAGRRQLDGKFTRDAVVFLSEIVFLMFMASTKNTAGVSICLIGLIGFMGTAVMKKELASRRCKLFFCGR